MRATPLTHCNQLHGRSRLRRVAMALLLVVGLFGPQAATAAPGDPPYDDTYMRLAEILGGLHHLRSLCGADEPQIWRDKMNALIAAEAPSPERKKRLIDQFNRSYRSLTEVYRSCTPAAAEIVERYLAEGAKISEEVLAKYGKP